MAVFFAPAAALMKRLKYPYKFALIGLVSGGAVGFLLFGMIAGLLGEIRQSQRELEGIKIVRPLLNSIQAFQQHRMLTASVAAGNAEFKDKIPAQEAQLRAAISEVDAAMASHGSAFGIDENGGPSRRSGRISPANGVISPPWRASMHTMR